jgi:hypothetical protein
MKRIVKIQKSQPKKKRKTTKKWKLDFAEPWV